MTGFKDGGARSVLVPDSANIQHSAQLTEIYLEVGIILAYLPSYSIESFARLKRYISRRMREWLKDIHKMKWGLRIFFGIQLLLDMEGMIQELCFNLLVLVDSSSLTNTQSGRLWRNKHYQNECLLCPHWFPNLAKRRCIEALWLYQEYWSQCFSSNPFFAFSKKNFWAFLLGYEPTDICVNISFCYKTTFA